VDGGVVYTRCLPEDDAVGACTVKRPDGDDIGVMSLPEDNGADKEASAHTSKSHETVEGSGEAAGDRGGKEDGVDDESGETDASEDANSDASSVDSWENEAPPLNLNYESLKHIVNHFLAGSHGACIDITTIRRGGFHEIRRNWVAESRRYPRPIAPTTLQLQADE
jgi:hypothetical protein